MDKEKKVKIMESIYYYTNLCEPLRKAVVPKECNGGYVYIVSIGKSIKIGISRNVKKRVSTIQSHSGETIKKIAISPECVNYLFIEQEMHKRFNGNCLHGEWFNVDFIDAVNELERFEFIPIKKQPVN